MTTRTPHSPDLQGWSLAIITNTLIGRRSYPSVEIISVYSRAPSNWAKIDLLKTYSYSIETYAKKTTKQTTTSKHNIMLNINVQRMQFPNLQLLICHKTSDRLKCRWRCSWCNGYRRRNWTRQHEFKSWTRLIAFHIVLIPLGKVWILLFSLHLWVNNRADLVLQPWWGI